VREHACWSLYHEPHGLTDSVPSWLEHWEGDGIIARIQTRAMAESIRASRIPVVDVLGVIPDLHFPLVHVDNRAIARVAAEHLLERGLRHFGFLGIQEENWSQERYEGLRQAVAHVQPEVALCELPRNVMDVRSWEIVENELAAWIANLPKPVGVMVCSDQQGPQLLEACRRAGVAVPDEVAVISVDNDEPLCEVCGPPLSSIEAGHLAVGYEAAALLDRMLKGARVGKEPVLIKPQQIVPRLSTEILAIDDPAIAAALRLIRDRAHEGIPVDAIARHVGLSRSVLQRRFRALLKRSVHQQILITKIKHAEQLLLKSDLPLPTIAIRAGFKHQEYMGAVFKSHIGTTPGALRRARGHSPPKLHRS
jgi:LacI family transcriptional regulator